MSGAYYNEHDKHAAAWLRELIRRDLIAPGDVDERSIVDVRADDLKGYTQCHFFAGIGVWSYALRLAGWSDDRPVWTGSCPCQPFSAAGKQKADEDDRHLAPVWLRLIEECRPPVLFGEQVGAAIRVGWLDHVFTALEQSEYACGAVDFPACSVGAPHIRQRLYFVADAASHRADGTAGREDQQRNALRFKSSGRGFLGDSDGRSRRQDDREPAQRDAKDESGSPDWDSGRGNANGTATAGFWADAEWLPCRDGKARPVEPGSPPLVAGAPARVVRLRGYGNSIVAPQAEAFIRAYLEV